MPSDSGGGQYNSNAFGMFGGRRHRIARPVYDPIDMSGIDSLRKRIRDADNTASDPLSAAGVQQQLATISEGLNRQYASEKGDAMSHAAQTGQAGFGGAFAQTSAQLSGNLAGTRAQTQSDMMLDVYTKARQEGMDATSALNQAQAEVVREKNERSRIDADLDAQEAQLDAQDEENQRRDILERARLAEDARQFDTSKTGTDEDRQWQHSQADKDMGFRQREEARQTMLDKEELRRNSLSEAQRAREEERQNRLDAEKSGFAKDENERDWIGTDLALDKADPVDEDDLARRGYSSAAIRTMRNRSPGFGGFGHRSGFRSRYSRSRYQGDN